MDGFTQVPNPLTLLICSNLSLIGDIVEVNAMGHYHVIDRWRNMIKVNGLAVSPLQIENQMLKHKRVIEVAVIGVRGQSSEAVLKAFVVLEKTDEDAGVIEELHRLINGMYVMR